jgi:heterodisulfide reductase subunit A
VAACPSAAITGAHFTNDQLMSEIEGILWDVSVPANGHEREAEAVPA